MDTQFLERHGRKWRVTVKVPLAARARIGKTYLKHTLNTDDLKRANVLKWEHVARLKKIIAAASNSGAGGVLDEALYIRMADEVRPPTSFLEADDQQLLVVTRAEQIAETHGEATGKAYFDLALGRATPLDAFKDDFLADWDYQPKSVLDFEKSLKRLTEFMQRQSHGGSVEQVTEAVAAGFLRDLLHRLGLSRKNVMKHVAFLRTYWTWMIDNDKIAKKPSPWSVKLPREKAVARHTTAEPDKGKRPYHDPEVRTLLDGTPPKQSAYLTELMPLAALSGMRLEELFMLRVRDVKDGFYHINVGKTVNAVRRVPIHSIVADTVARLCSEKPADAYLIAPEQLVVPKTGIRSSAASKAFTRYRRDCGVDERPNDKAKSNVDFHSFRRWFIKKAKMALEQGATGFTAWTIADVVGHDDEGIKDILQMTMKLYPGASGDEALRACVEAVQLPA